MRTFIYFIRRFFNLLLFLAIEVYCFVLVARTNTLQGNDLVSSANFVSGNIYKKQNDVIYYFGLRRMNDSLIRENLALRNRLGQLQNLDTLKDSMVHRRIVVGDSSKHIIKFADYEYRTAQVINNSTGATDNYVTINRGYKDGIGKNMAVISGTGIVGRVEHVSAHFASILSILSTKQKVSAKLKDGTTGYITWDEKDPEILQMTDVPQQVEVKKGDTVYTALFSLFSPNIMIGTVVKTEPVKKNAMQLISLRSSTNFRNLQYVYVIENKMADEKKQLEDSTIKK